jgi:hypothetical protein
METLIKDDDDLVTYLIETSDDKSTSLNFKVYEVNSWDENNNHHTDDLEVFLRGVIKWDGCSHIYFGDHSGYMHLCGNASFQDIKKVLDTVWLKAEREILNFDKDIAY